MKPPPEALKDCLKPATYFISWLMTILLVVGVSGASAERSFSVLRRLKSWLRSTMTQARLTQLSILAIEKEKSEETDCLKIARAFKNNERRERKFGKFPQFLN